MWPNKKQLKSDPFEPSIIDVYKERGQNLSYMAEPVNAFSNVSFLAAGMIAMAFAQDWIDWLLAFNIVVIGMGSFLYHTRPNLFTYFADVIPIIVFVLSYVFIYFNVFLGLGLLGSFIAWLMYFMINGVLLFKLNHKLNGSADYLPVIAMLFFGGVILAFMTGYIHLILASFIAIFSLIARTYDSESTMTTGSHFIWHILNGQLLCLLAITKSVLF